MPLSLNRLAAVAVAAMFGMGCAQLEENAARLGIKVEKTPVGTTDRKSVV